MAHQKSPNMSVKLMNKQEYMLLKNIPSIQPLKTFKINLEPQTHPLSKKINPLENYDRSLPFTQNKEEILTLLEFEKNERAKLESLINDLFNENKRLKQDIGHLDSSRLTENRLIQDYEHKISILKLDIQNSKRDQFIVQDYDNKIKAIQLQLDQEKSYQESQLNVIRSQQIEIKSLTDEIANNLRWKEESENKIALLAQEIQRLTMVLNDKSQEIEDLRMRSSQVQFRESEEHRQLIIDLKNEINRLQQKNYSFGNEKEKLEMEILKFNRENEALKMGNEDKLREIDNLAKNMLAKEKQHFQNMEDMRSKYDLMRQSVLNSEITEIQIRHKTEIIQLESLLKQFQSRSYECEQQIKMLQNDNDRYNQRLSDNSMHQTHQIDTLNNQIQSLTLENQHLSSKLHLSQNDVNSLNENVFTLQQQIQNVNQIQNHQIDQYQQEIDKLNNNQQQQQQQILTLKIELETNKIQYESKSEERLNLQFQLQQLQEQYNQLQQAYQDLDQVHHSIKNNLHTHEINSSSLQNQVYEHQQTHDKLQNIISQLQDQLNIGENQQKMIKIQYEKDFDILNHKLQEAQKVNINNSANYQNEIQSIFQKNMQLQFEIEDSKKQIDNFNNILQEKVDQINMLNDKLSEQKQSYEFSIHDMKSNQNNLLSNYQFENKSLNDKLQYANQQLIEISAENQVLKEQNYQNSNKIQDQEHKIFQLDINLKQTQEQYTNILNQFNSLRTINDQLQNQSKFEDLSKENLDLSSQLRELQHQIINLTSKTSLFEQKNEYLESTILIKQQELDELNNLLAKWKIETNYYQENTQQANSQLTSLKSELFGLQHTFNEMKTNLSAKQNLNSELQEQLYSLQHQSLSQKNEIQSLSSQLKQRNIEIELAKSYSVRASPVKH